MLHMPNCNTSKLGIQGKTDSAKTNEEAIEHWNG